MEGKDFARNHAAVHKYLYRMYERVSDSNPQISDNLRKLVDDGIECHKQSI